MAYETNPPAAGDLAVPDAAEAERFLQLLDPDATFFTFQTFDDDKERGDKRLARIVHGTLAEHLDLLTDLNAKGAGIFVTVNATDGSGRTGKNIARIRALFVDLDHAPIEPVLASQPAPHVVVESSPGRHQAYWLVADVGLKEFSNLQKVLAARFDGDASVHDLPRVMRLPGFFHRKSAPFMVRIIKVNDAAPCAASDFPQMESTSADELERLMVKHAGLGIAPDEPSPWKELNDAALANLDAWVPDLFGDAARHQSSSGGYRVSSKDLNRNLEEDLSLHPDGIKDWGVHDIGDEREGRRSPIDVVIEHGGKDFTEAADWLRAKLGKEPPKEELTTLRAQLDIADETAKKIADINREYALVIAGNKAAIMKLEGGSKFRLIQVGAFKQWFANQQVLVGKKVQSIADHWLGSKQRRQYEGIEFDPGGGRSGYYNLWRGFAVEPRAGDCSKFLDHLRYNVAKGDEDLFMWNVGWFAQIVQQPTVKLGTSLVYRGKMGVGKTKVGQIIGSLIGEDHYALVADPRYITGQFNSHMASLLLLQADEAFWAGDKRGEGKLRDLITGIVHFLEFKGIDPIQVRNFIRLFVTGNQDWIIPAGFGERRFAVFDVGEDHMQDHPYFAAIDEEMDNGGREALLHYLLNFDLSRVNLRVIPKTAALLEQQIELATPEQAWWLDTLKSGKLPSGTDEVNTCLKSRLYRRYIQHANLQGVRRRAIEVTIGMFLNKYVGSELKSNERLMYKVITSNGATITKRGWCYRFPPLGDCRVRFAEEMQQQGIAWGDVTEWHHEEDPIDLDDEPF